MKKLLMLGMAVAILAVTSHAQDAAKVDVKPATDKKEAPKMTAAEWDKKLKDELKLTEEQIAKNDALMKDVKDKMEALKADASLTEDVRREKMIALRKDKEKKFIELLTAEQQEAYKNLKESMKKGG